jgi:DNA-binding CsgD family transcriptional regulator
MYRLAKSLGLLVGEGSFEVADAGLSRAFELIGEVSAAEISGPVHAAAAEREVWRHEPRAAMEFVDRGLERLAATDDRTETARLCRIGAWAAADLAESARAPRDESAVAEARELLARIRERMDRRHEAATAIAAGPTLAGAVDRATLEAEAGRLEGDADPAAWRAVADGWAALERPYLAAYARWREGEAALAAGDRVAATNAIQTSHTIATRLGAGPLREAVEALGRRARISTAAAEPSPQAQAPTSEIDRFGLTRREREVLALVADGHTNRQIAETLFISESTAGVHVSNILGKLGVTSRVQAAAIAYRMGLVPTES